jgi:selenocysteine-specific elongation factor
MSARRLTLGTAGHIDHGKTMLVKALTGTDTDRLPEEKRRGISIVLGYAQLELPNGIVSSVIDVPGHERLVRTMVAGATGIDLFLLVVDAAEGPKPQTLEHLEILRLLGVEHGVIAVTKIDAVDESQLRAALAAVAELAPAHEHVAVSALDGRGLPEIREALGRVAAYVDDHRREGPTRLYVDRAFSLPGAGRIVTGTLWSGSVRTGDTLEVLPGGHKARVRSVEVHGRKVELASSGQRVALAVSTERRRLLSVGDAIVEPGSYRATYRLDIALAPGDRVAGSAVTVCHGTSSLPARIVRAGDRFAQLRLTRPLVAARGDHVVLRQDATVGGGVVLDTNPPRRIEEQRLEVLQTNDLAALVAALVDAPVDVEALRVRLNVGEAELVTAFEGFARIGRWVCSIGWLEATRLATREKLEAREGEVDPGLPLAALIGSDSWTGAVAEALGLEAHGGKFYLPGQRPASGSRGSTIENEVAAAGLKPVAVSDADLALTLEREGRIVRLGDGFAIGPDAYARFKSALFEEYEASGVIVLARFRDRAGVSRRVAQLVLERFDADRLTLRIGDERKLRRSALV